MFTKQQTFLIWLTTLLFFFYYGRTTRHINRVCVNGFSSTSSFTTGKLILSAPGRRSGISNHHFPISTTTTAIRLLQQDEETTTTINSSSNNNNAVIDEAQRLKKEAEMMRLQAEKMDLSLTLSKIDTLEKKLSNKSWIDKYPQKAVELKQQLQRLQDKLLNNNNNTQEKGNDSSTTTTTTSSTTTSTPSSSTSELKTTTTTTKSDNNKSTASKSSSSKQPKIVLPPVLGFDDTDLELYIPVAKDINKMMVNDTLEDRLEAFRTAPELQSHFQEKIQKMLVGPLEEMQKLESLKSDYLRSTSSVEREQLKRQIDQLESGIQDDSVIAYTDSIYCGDALPPLTDEALKERVEAINNTLPDILIAIYKQRNKVPEDSEEDNLELAIQMDYYEPQLQLLEQVPSVEPIADEIREEFGRAYDSLPEPVQERFVENTFGGFDEEIYGPDYYYDSDDVLEKLVDDANALSGLLEAVKEVKGIKSGDNGGSGTGLASLADLPEYNDIEFVDRSRYLEEFYPSIGNMESDHPSLEDVEIFANKIINKKHFMVTSKPERVLGGYYIRGTNLLTDNNNEDGGSSSQKTAADKLVDRVTESLAKNSTLAEKIDFFYILDPAPPTDEELELGEDGKPIILVTGKNPTKLYKRAAPLTKTVTSILTILSTFMFSVGSCALNPVISDRVDGALETAKVTGIIDLDWLTQLVFPLFLSLCAIQLVHEIAHRIVAAVYKFDVGLPNFMPSITTGVTGAITPLRSPPPSTKAMFDFGLSGPVAGLLVSLALLLVGLDLTASMEMDGQLPVVPVGLVRASSLGGGLVRYFLGTGVTRPDLAPTEMVNLHPFAISGLVGCIINSLALLPLGHTDGGRVSLAMFGRRGSFVVKLFTTLILVLAGIFGLDDENIFLAYILFVSVFQRELETPSKNEVDELDFPRGLLGISAAIVVGLVLIPMF